MVDSSNMLLLGVREEYAPLNVSVAADKGEAEGAEATKKKKCASFCHDYYCWIALAAVAFSGLSIVLVVAPWVFGPCDYDIVIASSDSHYRATSGVVKMAWGSCSRSDRSGLRFWRVLFLVYG